MVRILVFVRLAVLATVVRLLDREQELRVRREFPEVIPAPAGGYAGDPLPINNLLCVINVFYITVLITLILAYFDRLCFIYRAVVVEIWSQCADRHFLEFDAEGLEKFPSRTPRRTNCAGPSRALSSRTPSSTAPSCHSIHLKTK